MSISLFFTLLTSNTITSFVNPFLSLLYKKKDRPKRGSPVSLFPVIFLFNIFPLYCQSHDYGFSTYLQIDFSTGYKPLSIPGNTGKIRCSVQVIRGALVDVIITFICTPSGYNKSSKIKGFQGSTPYHFSALPHFYPTVSSTKFNNFFITS